MDREVKFFQVILYCGKIQYLARNSHQMEHILLFISSNILYLLPWSLQSHPLFHSTSLLFKIHQKCLFVARPLCSSLSFLAEAQPRLKTGEDKRLFLAEVHIQFFSRPRELQSKRYHWKNYKFLYLLSACQRR
jgi:hypothetical protein